MRVKITDEEMLKISASLEDYHKCFYVFWEMSEIYFTDELPTAAIKFNKYSKPTLLINREFWNRHNDVERLFVVCHECLHVLLDHGIRNGLNVPGATPYLVNVAQDITINEMIIDLFKFFRPDLREWKRYCWIDTCFKDPSTIQRNQTFYYYLNELIKQGDIPESEDGSKPSTMDEHVIDENGNSEEESFSDQKNKEDIAKTISQELDANEIESILKALPEAKGAGNMSGAYEDVIAKKVVLTRLDFKKLVGKLKRTAVSQILTDVDSFTHESRRFRDVIRKDAVLPGQAENSRPSKDRLLTAVFMDVSGSCMPYFDVFTKAFLAFDAEKDTFETRLFSFDVKVKEVKPGDSVKVGGGTYFNILENKCLELETEVGRYPDCVVVITDGDGNEVSPKAASKWIWLLTPFGKKDCIPKMSKAWKITDVTF